MTMRSFLHDFASNPSGLHISRSTFDRNFRHKTSFNEGQLVNFFVDEVLPGDTFSVKTNSLVRLSNPLVRPVMDDMYLDIYYFFVPGRLLWSHFTEMHGENNSSFWSQPTEYVLPQWGYSDVTGHIIKLGDFHNRCGVGLFTAAQAYADSLAISPLPYAGYCKIWNEWFRDENYQDPSSVPDTIYKLGSHAEVVYEGALLNVNRYHDYFSSCLPAPQKGAAVSLPLNGNAPVTGSLDNADVYFINNSQSVAPAGASIGVGGSVDPNRSTLSFSFGGNSSNYAVLNVDDPSVSGTADLSGVTAATVNQLRQAFALQRLFERDARGGTRYTEMLRSHFGVTNPDARLQRSEYLGGSHTLLNVTQVQQTAPGGSTSSVGSLGAYSLTGSSDGSFVKSFTEFGYVYGLACVRVKHSYSQGVPRMFTKHRRFDFYYPGLANIGEQPVYTREIYEHSGSNVFGFQEAWAEYRYMPDIISGMLTPGQTTDMTAWTFGDHYTSSPTLSSSWLQEGASNIDQSLAVPSATADQFIADFGVLNKCTRPMPLYSVPGLIDHN